MLSRAAKDEQIKQFNAAFKANPAVMVVEYKGLSVNEMEKLRKDVKGANAELTVVKNTLLKIAAKDTDIEQIGDLFVGPTAVAICDSDPSAVAKVFVETVKDVPMLKVKGGFVDGSVFDANGLVELSKLPSRPELIAEFMGLLKAPMSNVVGALTQIQTKLLYALEALKEVKEKEPQKPAEKAETAEPAAEAKEQAPKEEPKEAESKEAEAKEAETESETPELKEAPEEKKAEEAAETSEAAEDSTEAAAEEPEAPQEEGEDKKEE